MPPGLLEILSPVDTAYGQRAGRITAPVTADGRGMGSPFAMKRPVIKAGSRSAAGIAWFDRDFPWIAKIQRAGCSPGHVIGA
jgi:hypothetical protein